MAMEINGSYGNAQISYLERRREEQPLEKTSGTAQSKEGQKEEKTPVQDEYISREKSGAKPTGLYWLGEDENGNRKIFMMTRKVQISGDKKRHLTKSGYRG